MTTETPDLDKLIAKARATIKPTDSIRLTLIHALYTAIEATKRERDEARATLAKVAEWAKFADKSFSDRVQMPTSNLNSLLALLDAAPAVTTAPEPCPTCSGPIRETTNLVCETCGTDYGAEAGDREALIDALLDVERSHDYGSGHVPGADEYADAAIAAGFHRSTAPAEAEPVAWLDRYNVAWVADEWPTEKIAAQYAEKAGPLIPLYRHPAKPIEVTDAMVLVALNTYFSVDITLAEHGEQDDNDMRAALSAALKEMNR